MRSCRVSLRDTARLRRVASRAVPVLAGFRPQLGGDAVDRVRIPFVVGNGSPTAKGDGKLLLGVGAPRVRIERGG